MLKIRLKYQRILVDLILITLLKIRSNATAADLSTRINRRYEYLIKCELFVNQTSIQSVSTTEKKNSELSEENS